MSAETASPPVEYHEAGRGYASVAYFAVPMIGGFLLDLHLGGGKAHLPGWIAAFVIVVGINLLVIHAARVTKSLTVTAEEIRIGDEVIGRNEIVGADEGKDPALPVLGWQTGAPRGIGAVTLVLDDDQEVVVPTRHPDRLLAALGVGVTVVDGDDLEIREADEDDLPLLDEIDERAGTLFRISGYDLPEIRFAQDEMDDSAAIFVAGRPPVAFARVSIVDGVAHLAEIAVIPGSMKRGLGSGLIDRACEWAREAGHDAMTLTTYVDVPWNGPMYARRGWVAIDDPSPGVAAIRAREIEVGLDAVGRRVVMRRDLGHPPEAHGS